MLRIGLLINPIAGIGGQAGHKGSDVDWQADLEAGFEPPAPGRAKRFLDALRDVEVVSPPGAMGIDGTKRLDGHAKKVGATTPEDTRDWAKRLAEDVDLLCFVGGDGTATDVAAAGLDVPCLGIPGGVKITSPVFAHDPEEAAWLVSHLAPGFETIARDVTDLDEAAYRAGRLDVRLTGSLRVPASPHVQGGKVATTADTPLEPLVETAMRDWDPEALHIIGAGSVMMAMKRILWGQPTLLGVDAYVGDRQVAADIDARQAEALAAEHERVHIWLSIIGGQGMILGRGTQVLSPQVLRKAGWDRIHVVAPAEKLMGTSLLHVDSGDVAFDQMAPRYIAVVTGWNERRMVRVASGIRPRLAG